MDDFQEFESKIYKLLDSIFSSAVTIFFRLGAWIDQLNIDTIKQLEDILCDKNDYNSDLECVFIKRNSLKNGTLCLTRLDCTENMLFMCDSEHFVRIFI